jgi:hypothetical protein
MVATTRAPGASLKAPFASNCLSPFPNRPNSKSVEAGLPNQLPEAWGAGGRAFESLRAQSTQQREATAAPRPIRYERPGVVVVIETNGMRRARPWGLLGDSSIASARCWRIWQPSPRTAFRPSSKVSRASTCSPRQRLRSFGVCFRPRRTSLRDPELTVAVPKLPFSRRRRSPLDSESRSHDGRRQPFSRDRGKGRRRPGPTHAVRPACHGVC